MLNAIFSKEHVLRAAQSNALSAEQARIFGVARNVGVGANAQAANRIDPAHELHEIGIIGLRLERLEPAVDYAARRSVNREPVALLVGAALHAQFLLRFVYDAIACAGHAALAHAAGNDSGVRGHAAARSQNSVGNFHAGDVLRRGFAAHENDGLVRAVADAA